MAADLNMIVMRQRDERIARSARTEAENAQMRAILRRFSRFADALGRKVPVGMDLLVETRGAKIRFADCLAAAELLDVIEAGEPR